MAWPRALVLAYGLFIIAAGAAGAQKSIISLVAGGIAGLLLIGCFALIPSKPRIGYIGATVIALANMGNFARPFFNEGKVWPAGVVFGVSAVVVLALTAAHFMSKKKAETAA